MTADDHTDFDPATTLDQIDAATEHLIETAAWFTDADVRVGDAGVSESGRPERADRGRGGPQYRKMPPEAWNRTVRCTRGQE